MKITIHVATIDHRHGTTQFVDQIEDNLRYQVDCYCREWAEREGVTLTDDMTTSEVIDAYFGKVEDEIIRFDEHEIEIAVVIPILPWTMAPHADWLAGRWESGRYVIQQYLTDNRTPHPGLFDVFKDDSGRAVYRATSLGEAELWAGMDSIGAEVRA